MITDVVTALSWTWVYDVNGPLNTVLRAVGLGHFIPAAGWLGDFNTALPAVGVFGMWGEFGFCLILFLAGVMKIPASLYEAARVDGANAVREFFAVTLPGLRYELQVVLVLSVIGTLGTFDEILRHDQRRAGHRHHRARVPGVAAAVPDRPGRVGGSAGHRPDADRLRGHVRAEPRDGAKGGGVNTTSRAQVTFNYFLIAVCSLIAIYPLVGIIFASLYPSGPGSAPSGFSLPPTFAWHNYVAAWDQGNFASSFATSLIVAAVMVPASVFLSVVAGYAFATMRFRGSKLLFYLFILGLIIPTEATIVPLYYDVRAMGLLDTYWALIILETSGELAFGIFWMRAAFLSAPQSLLEAARIDGASSWMTLWRIMVPFAKPAILTLTVLTFADSWNEFFLALVFTVNHMTAPAGLASFSGRYTTDVPLVSAGAVIVAIPIVIVFIIFQREFMRGMLTGAVKG